MKKKKDCTEVYIAAFIAISKNNHPPTGEWINNELRSNEKGGTIDFYTQTYRGKSKAMMTRQKRLPTV